MSKHVRIRVKLQRKGERLSQFAKFTECILQYFHLTGAKKGIGHVHVCLKDNCLEMSDEEFTGSAPVMIKHPSFCPVLHLSSEMIAQLPKEIATRGVDVGAVILLESCDGHILLTRRARHLNIFPGLWVPPGGHIEENETMLQAGLRELQEETGLKLGPQDCVEKKIELIGLWESVFPPKVSVGPPKRHHIVVYFHARLVQGLTATELERRLKFDPGEVDACAWMDKNLIESIVNSDDEGVDSSSSSLEHLPSTFRALILDGSGKQCFDKLPAAPLFRIHSDGEDDTERVSTGTKFALQQLLHLFPASSL